MASFFVLELPRNPRRFKNSQQMGSIPVDAVYNVGHNVRNNSQR